MKKVLVIDLQNPDKNKMVELPKYPRIVEQKKQIEAIKTNQMSNINRDSQERLFNLHQYESILKGLGIRTLREKSLVSFQQFMVTKCKKCRITLRTKKYYEFQTQNELKRIFMHDIRLNQLRNITVSMQNSSDNINIQSTKNLILLCQKCRSPIGNIIQQSISFITENIHVTQGKFRKMNTKLIYQGQNSTKANDVQMLQVQFQKFKQNNFKSPFGSLLNKNKMLQQQANKQQINAIGNSRLRNIKNVECLYQLCRKVVFYFNKHTQSHPFFGTKAEEKTSNQVAFLKFCKADLLILQPKSRKLIQRLEMFVDFMREYYPLILSIGKSSYRCKKMQFQDFQTLGIRQSKIQDTQNFLTSTNVTGPTKFK